jgi:hypothetical protein
MKVSELLNEAPACPPGYVMGPAGLCIPASPTPSPAPTPAPVPPKKPRINKQIVDFINNSQKKWRANQVRVERIKKVWMGRYGTPLVTLMKFLGVVVPLTNLYVDLEAFEQEYANGEVSKDGYEFGREYLFGTFIVQVLTPVLIRRLSQTWLVLGITRALVAILSAVSAPFTAGVSIAALVASEAFFLWLQTFLSTGAGKDWLANFVGTNIIRTMGKIPDSAWSSLTDAYKKADKAKLKKQDPAKAAEVEKQEKQDASDLEKSKAFRKELGI